MLSTFCSVTDRATLLEDLARSADAVVQTTGEGGTRALVGSAPTSATDLPRTIDILRAALDCAGGGLGFGALRDAVLTFDEGVVVLGRAEGGTTVAALGRSDTNPGLLLAHLRRLLTKQDEPDSRHGGDSA